VDERVTTAAEVALGATATIGTTPKAAHTKAVSPRNSAPLVAETRDGGESGSRPGVVRGSLDIVPLESDEDQAADEAFVAQREKSGTLLAE
jgi:hypothetical protein